MHRGGLACGMLGLRQHKWNTRVAPVQKGFFIKA